MSDFHRGDLVQFNYNTAVGYVRELTRIDGVNGYIVDFDIGPDKIGSWFAPDDDVSKLPDELPALPHGATVHVAPDAPQHADRYGTVTGPEFHGCLFGYWVNLTGPSEHVWVPAGALALVKIGGAR